MPQNFPALKAQVGAAEGTAIEVVGLELVDEVVIDVLEEVVEVDFVPVDDDPIDAPVEMLVDVVLIRDVVFVPETCWGIVVELEVVVGCDNETGVVLFAEFATAPPGVRYQFVSGSWRHSPAVTPFQPRAWITPK